MGLFLLAIVLGFAAVSYVAALRAARGRAMRTKLLPEAVDRTISQTRDQAIGPREAPLPQAGPARPTERPAAPHEPLGDATDPSRSIAPCTMPNGPTGQRKQSTISASTCSRVAMPSSMHAFASLIIAM